MHITISPSSGEPIYSQIVSQVKEQIWDGTLPNGYALPSIRQLAKDLRISVITTKRAYEELERDGYITSHVGRGSFVSWERTEELLEDRKERVRELIGEAVKEGKRLNMSSADLVELLRAKYEED
ncbi:GntR family transcriptional regulator [Paenibacillus thermotolerans]|uniref:GntR family transcriptional regulator n=1 Tax=Paenibacillus thermotolerans TaxID=3027807 RepID=UPI0023679377|nr:MULTISPECIES: GntR family transcriptional regulator [unclassified Paenibacillus]